MKSKTLFMYPLCQSWVDNPKKLAVDNDEVLVEYARCGF